jgi:hypothetical protein
VGWLQALKERVHWRELPLRHIAHLQQAPAQRGARGSPPARTDGTRSNGPCPKY